MRVVPQCAEEVEHAEADGHVEHRDGFVGDQHLRPHRQRAGNGDPLALAAGQLVREFAHEGFGWLQRDSAQEVGDRHARVVARQVVDLQRSLQLVADAVYGVERCERVLQDHLDLGGVGRWSPGRRRPALQQHLACIGLDDFREQPRHCRLSRAALADQRGHGPRLEAHGYAVHGADGRPAREWTPALLEPEVLGQIATFEDGRFDSAHFAPTRIGRAVVTGSA